MRAGGGYGTQAQPLPRRPGPRWSSAPTLARSPSGTAAIYLATAPKSNSAYRALLAATRDVRERGALPTPLHLRNAPTGLMKSLGYGADYIYPHDEPGHVADQEYLPSELEGRRYYEPGDQGYEQVVRERLEAWEALKKRGVVKA